MALEIIRADLTNPVQAADYITLMSLYARDPMGGGQHLDEQVRANLPAALASRPFAVTFIAHKDGAPAGLVTCLEGFSTFACKPLLNIHDVIVVRGFRGQNIAGKLLEAAEAEAIKRGCCKLTLEVLQGNSPARKAYRRFGFAPYSLDPAMGSAEFWEKGL